VSAIHRNIEQAEADDFDVIIVGGGIYGAMIMLESVRAGLRPLLLEQSDFGAGTSFNNLRIVHGGLRYLQTLHLTRIRESVAERRWFLATYPELVRPLPCIMPLYGGLTRNGLVMRNALAVNDWLSRKRNAGVDPSRHLPAGRVLSAGETRERFPAVRKNGLKSAALWYDAVAPDCHRILIETLRWAAAGNGVALNHVEAIDLVTDDNGVRGVVARDRISGRQHEFRAHIVVNAAGPWSRELSARFDEDRAELFRPSLAWNVLLDRPALSDCAVAVQPPKPGGRVYFAHSLDGRLFVRTGHAVASDGKTARPSDQDMQAMLDDLNLAIPDLNLETTDIVRLFSGFLPVRRSNTVNLSDTCLIHDHTQHGGPEGFVTISGVKYTTARSSAEKLVGVLGRYQRSSGQASPPGLPERPPVNEYRLHPRDCTDSESRVSIASALIESESPQSLEDLLVRRSNLVSDPDNAVLVAEECCVAFGWDDARCAHEMDCFKDALKDAAYLADCR
jgi:glycerol-3-phosphate dehydrogenase